MRWSWGAPLARLLPALALVSLLGGAAEAAPAKPAAGLGVEPRVLRVGLSPFPPLVFEGGPPERGFDISLWESLAGRIGVETRYVRIDDFSELLDRVARGEIDVALGGISITAAREARMDFSYSYLRSGLGILTTTRSSELLQRSHHPLLGPEGFTLGRTLLLLGGTALVVGTSALLFWWIELRPDPAHAARPGRSIAAALYWAVVTMSTVGYGDYTPKRPAGKVVALVLIFSGIGLFGAVVARMSSVLTVSQLRDLRPHPRELRGVAVGTLDASSAIPVIRHFGGIVRGYPQLGDAIKALEQGQVEAVVSDWPALYYHVNTQPSGDLVLSEEPFDEQLYALALPPGSPWRKPINLALLQVREDGVLSKLITNYFGEDFRLNNVIADE
ncbi:MAG: transporter substrate-binding domain-containing protein [Synechococcus sp.]|nr:transporter substrate-binding domain-containing protein [Synechococcus sp.]